VGGDHHARVGRGLDVVPGAVVLTGFSSDETASLRLLSALTSNPGRVGIGIDAGTAIAIDGASRTLPGRGIQVLGEGDVTLLLAANEFKPVRRQVYRARRGEMSVASEEDRAQTGQRRGARAGQRRGGRQGRGETRGARGGGGGRIIADLGAWRRDAIERTLPEPFPAPEPVTPFVENGTLFIVGGGGSPTDLYRKMVEKAGGDAAKFVYIPCSEAADVGDQSRTANNFVRNGAAEATWIHTKDRVKANTDEAILGPLREATGLWFGGGRQWNFVDSYHGTTAMELMQDVLARGGVVGGSSAGASIQGEWLARADPLGNADILAPGYERGLGFIEGVAIDQHFRQRNRFLNMTGLMKEYPQLLGIGLDEATAIVVEKSIAEVIGRNEVHFYDFWNRPPRDGEKDHVSLGVGGRYDMAARKVLAWGSGRSMLAGSWHLIVDSPHGAMPATMRVVEDDLSGAFTFESKEYALADLNISEGRVRFGVTLDMQGEAIVLAFEGELNERELTGRLTGEFHGEAQAMNVKGAKEEGGSECEDS
jgi:cyanophycinase